MIRLACALQKLSRKLVHITTGPLFVLTWPLFSSAPEARYYAAVIPVLQGIRCEYRRNAMGVFFRLLSQ